MEDAQENHFIRLTEVEPSPFEETTTPKSLPPQRSRSVLSTLGLGGCSWDYYLSAIQKYSTYPPTAFLFLHFANTALIPLVTQSAADSDPYLLSTRPIYQAPVLEHALLTLPIAAHVASGIARRVCRARRHARYTGAKSWSPPLNLQSRLGFLMIPLLIAHVGINRVAPVEVEGGSSSIGLGYVAHGIARVPLLGAVYVGLVGIGVWHFVGGITTYALGWRDAIVWPWPTILGSFGGKYPPNEKSLGAAGGYLGSADGVAEYSQKRVSRWWIASGAALTVTVLWLGGMNVVTGEGTAIGWEAKNWDRIYAAVPVLRRYFVNA